MLAVSGINLTSQHSTNKKIQQNKSFSFGRIGGLSTPDVQVFTKTEKSLINAFKAEGFSSNDAIGFVTSQLTKGGLKVSDLADIAKQLRSIRKNYNPLRDEYNKLETEAEKLALTSSQT